MIIELMTRSKISGVLMEVHSAQVVEALQYKAEGRGFDCQWCRCNFSLTRSFWLHTDPGVDSASNRNE